MLLFSCVNYISTYLRYVVDIYVIVLTVQFSQNMFIGPELSGRVPVTLSLGGGISAGPISVAVTPSDQSPVSAQGRRCMS